MKNLRSIIQWLTLMALVVLPSGCRGEPQVSPTPAPVYSAPELKYQLLSSFSDVFWCDPDLYPIAREGQEEKNAREQFPAIRENAAEFSAILTRLGLPGKAEYTGEEKLLIYREHKKLTYMVEFTPSGGSYLFNLRIKEGQGERLEGTITPSGKITVLKREISFNTCPICLTRGTLIDTPDGSMPVEQLRKGMGIWTVDSMGKRVGEVVVETRVTPVPPSFTAVSISLEDGRIVTASPGHPASDGRALGEYRVGDTLDGARVVAVVYVTCDGDATYDIMPSGTTGLYWANGILLKSTLATR